MITINSKGEIINEEPLNFEFIRQPDYSQVVTNSSGESKGILYVFGRQMAMGKKSLKDPIENRFNVVFIGLD